MQPFEEKIVWAERTAGRACGSGGEGRQELLGGTHTRGALRSRPGGIICRPGYRWIWRVGFTFGGRQLREGGLMEAEESPNFPVLGRV